MKITTTNFQTRFPLFYLFGFTIAVSCRLKTLEATDSQLGTPIWTLVYIVKEVIVRVFINTPSMSSADAPAAATPVKSPAKKAAKKAKGPKKAPTHPAVCCVSTLFVLLYAVPHIGPFPLVCHCLAVH